MYTVYGSIQSRAFRVVWALEEIGEPYELVPAKPQSPEARAVNPSGKVPVLKVGDETITDSTAILTYLADSHGKLTYPAGSIERARQDALTHFLLDEFDAVLWTYARHSFVLPEDKRVPEVKDSLKWEFSRSMERLSGHLKGPFLMGDMMTVSDIICTHCLNWAYAAKFPLEHENVTAYAKAMRARDAFKRTAALAG